MPAMMVMMMIPVDTGRKMNVHKTYRTRPGRLLNVLCTFNVRPVSTVMMMIKMIVCLQNSSNLVYMKKFYRAYQGQF